MALLGLPFEHRSVSVFRHMDTFKAINPLVKAPTPVCDDGTVLHDSNLILQYVESLAAPKTLWPTNHAAFVQALRITANALVAMEKTVQCVYEEQTRPPEKRHQPWLDRVTAQLQAAYDLIEADVAKAGSGYFGNETLTRADINVAVAWRFTQFVQAQRAPKEKYAQIAAFAARLEKLPEFVLYLGDLAWQLFHGCAVKYGLDAKFAELNHEQSDLPIGGMKRSEAYPLVS